MISYFAGAWLRHSNTTHSLWRLAPIIYSPALLAPGHGAQTLGFYLYFNFYLPAEKLFLIRVSMCVWMGPIHRISLIIFGTFYCILFSFFFFLSFFVHFLHCPFLAAGDEPPLLLRLCLQPNWAAHF